MTGGGSEASSGGISRGHPIGREAILAARERIRPHVFRTPLLASYELNAALGARVTFKCECLQRTGSFKMRGAANAVFSLSDEEASRGVATHSSGNHGQALALAAKLRGIPATVVIPRGAPEVKRAAVESHGAEVVECEPTMAAREEALARVIRRTGAAFIHPYDDDRVIAGQATACAELVEEKPDTALVLAPVSGGGLLSGTALSARLFSERAVAWGVEPEGADDAARSLAAGMRLPQTDPRTMADGLRASLSDRTFSIIRGNAGGIVTVSEASIAKAMHLLFTRLKLVVEPSGAVPLAALIEGKVDASGGRVGVVLSGGNVSAEAFSDILRSHGLIP